MAHVVAVFNARRKSQGAVIALALLLGGVGAHRWYLGDTKTGWIFVALFVSGFFLVIPWVVALVWSLVDALNSRALTNAANERVWSELILGAGPGSFGRHGAGR